MYPCTLKTLMYPEKRTEVPKQKASFYSAAENTMFIDNEKHDTSVTLLQLVN